MSDRHYSDYLEVKDDYRPNMTREAINETPDMWRGFVPHKNFVEFLQTLLSSFETGHRSTWLTGNYGTGKSNAALVVQKLFMDDEERVRRWFKDRSNFFSDASTLQKKLFAWRSKTLVVYDYNASGLDADREFLVRLEKGVVSTLRSYGLQIPARGNLDAVIERLQREGQNFIQTRDLMTEDLTESFCAYKNVEEIIKALRNEASDNDVLGGTFAEVQKVLRQDNIFLNVGVPEFRIWIKKILELNDLKNVVYIFDEFSEFIEAHKTRLKTFEEVTESPNVNHFFLVPVTHLSLNAFWSETSSDAKRARDRFIDRKLEMPSDVAFQLAADAFKEREEFFEEWKNERENLFSSIIGVVDQCQEDGIDRQRFMDLLPIHPLSAFFLKFLSESVSSNQRSLFEYLKGNAQGREFQDFIEKGGPSIYSRQFLTIDYLWKYFVERDGELGLREEIASIGREFKRLRNTAEFSNKMDDDVELRVLKAVFLFILLGRLNPDGHRLLQPTVSNVCLAFQGDGSVVNVEYIVKNLAEVRHCFTIVGAEERIDLFASSVGRDELDKKCNEWEDKFHELLHLEVEKQLEGHISHFKPGYSERFVLRASDYKHMTWGNLPTATRDKYGSGNDSDGTILLWFVFAKNHEEELEIPSKIETFLKQSKDDFRILFFTCRERSFCEDNSQLWLTYRQQRAQCELSGGEDVFKGAYKQIETNWLKKIKDPSTIVTVHRYEGGKVVAQEIRWNALSSYLEKYVRRTLPYCVDYLAGELNNAFDTKGYKGWAKAGIKFEGALSPQSQLVGIFKSQGIDAEGSTLASEHPLSQLKTFFEGKFKNTVDRGANYPLHRAYIELRRSPYGFKPCAVTAFCLGYALKWTLTKGYQWTNEQISGELDVDTLAEIIETVVKDDGADKIKNEKTICRLSKADKTFIKQVPKIFGCVDECQKVEEATSLIQGQVSRVSKRVPLWILAKYVGKRDQERGAQIQEIFETICQICRISSKKKTAAEERTGHVKKIGELLLNDSSLVKAASEYVKSENFINAFKEYVDALEPKLRELASNVSDVSGMYCESVLSKIPEEGGVLWNERNISDEINTTIDEYRAIFAAKSILGFQSFTPYLTVVKQLQNRVKYVKAPGSMIVATFPSLNEFLSCLLPADEDQRCSASVLAETLEQYSNDIKSLFDNAGRTATLKILRPRFGNDKISDDKLMELVNDISVSIRTSEKDFIDELHKKQEEYAKKSVEGKLRDEWIRVSGMKSPVEWAKKRHIPPQYAFDDASLGREYSVAVVSPQNFSSQKLDEILEYYRGIEKFDVDASQRRFLEAVVPSAYAGFGITFGSLVNYLYKKYGDNPCLWPSILDINQFIKEQYLTEFAPKIAQKIEDTAPEDLKKQVLALVKENQNVGMYFWQDK